MNYCSPYTEIFSSARSDGTRSVRPAIAAAAFDRCFGGGFTFHVDNHADEQKGKADCGQNDSNFVKGSCVSDFEPDNSKFAADC